MIGIMSWEQLPYYVPFLFFMIFILAFNKCCEIKTVVWCMCCQSKNAVVLCETRYWSKPPKVTVLDLRAILAKLKSQHTSNAWEFRMEKIWLLTMSLLLIYVGFGILDLSIVENVGYQLCCVNRCLHSKRIHLSHNLLWTF